MTTPRLPREDLTAAMAARRELGPDYDDAFIETVVERIEETLDARTAAAPRPRRHAPAPEPRRGGERDHSLALAVLSLLAAIPLSAIGVVNAGLPGLIFALAGIALINFTYTFRPR
jgi:ferric-dicitrate binding protein FerR (iron transport regulator)